MNEILEIISLLPYLAISVSMNILVGTYNNVHNLRLEFNLRKFLNGIIKAGIVTFVFIGTALIVDKIGLTLTNEDPKLTIKGAIALYTYKSLKTFTVDILKGDEHMNE